MNVRWKAALFVFVALFDLSSRAQALSGFTAMPVADGTALIDLPAGWLHSSPAFVAALNEKAVKDRPTTKTRFTESVYPVIGSDRLPDIQLLMIGKSPQSRPPLTPERLVALYPQVLPSVEKKAAEMGAGFDATQGTSAVHYDAKLRAVVNDATITFPSGELVRTRQYTVFSSASVVSFVAYSSISSSETFFRDVDQIVGTTAFKEVDRLPESWFESVRKLFGSP